MYPYTFTRALPHGMYGEHAFIHPRVRTIGVSYGGISNGKSVTHNPCSQQKSQQGPKKNTRLSP